MTADVGGWVQACSSPNGAVSRQATSTQGGTGPGPADFAGQADRGAGGVLEHRGGKAAVRQPGAEPVEYRVVGVDAAPAGDGDQVADQRDHRLVVFVGGSQHIML